MYVPAYGARRGHCVGTRFAVRDEALVVRESPGVGGHLAQGVSDTQGPYSRVCVLSTSQESWTVSPVLDPGIAETTPTLPAAGKHGFCGGSYGFSRFFE